MLEQRVSLASNGVVKVPGYEQLVHFGYTKNRGVYRLAVTAIGEWDGLTIRAFWHTPGGKEPASSLVADGFVDVPAIVTAQSGNGCITFEGSDGTKTVTSADLRYRVSANSGTEDGTEPEPGTPAWQQLVDAVHTDATAAEQAKTDARTAANQAGASAQKAGQALADTVDAKEAALDAIGDKQTAATQAVDTARDKALQQVEASTEAAKTAASEAAASAGNASQSAAKSSAAASNANASAENAAHAQVTASQLAGQAADSASEAQNSATKAAASQQAAESNAAAAQGSATKADASASAAVQGQQRAEAAATRAETAQRQTESASTDALDKISAAKADALKAVDAKQAAATAAVESTSKKALDAVTAAQGTAVKAVSDAQSTATQAVQTAQTDAVSAVEKAGSEVLESIPEDYQATVQKVEELKTEKAEIDDSTVGLDAWSSKHIVDMLCPPLEETGNPVQCYPVAGYPLGCKVSWEPTQEGSGEPSPENVRPIKGRDSMTVERCGENLLHIAPFSTETKKGVTFEYVPDGGVRIQGTASANTDSPTFPVGHLPPGKYYGLDMDTGIVASIVVVRAGKNLWLNAKGTFEIIQGDIVKYWYMIANNGNTANTTVYPYIVHGTTPPTTCSPYTGQTATLTLHHTIYGGTVDAVTGEGQETWKLLTLDGTEAWTSESTKVSGKYGYILREKNIQTTTNPSLKGQIVCNKYVTRSANDTYTNHTGISVEFENNKYFRIYDEAYADKSISAWKSYLAAQYAEGTPVQVCYKLATPTPFTAAGGVPIKALSGTNTVLTDADSATVTGRADPIKRITDLEDAVASMT